MIMNEQQIWELITSDAYVDGEGYININRTWDELSRLYSGKLAEISEKLSLIELVDLISIGMVVHHKGIKDHMGCRIVKIINCGNVRTS